MFKSVRDFESAMVNTLVLLRDENDLSQFTNDTNFSDSLAECVKLGYITEIEYFKNANNDFIFDFSNPRITLSGLEFIENHQ